MRGDRIRGWANARRAGRRRRPCPAPPAWRSTALGGGGLRRRPRGSGGRLRPDRRSPAVCGTRTPGDVRRGVPPRKPLSAELVAPALAPALPGAPRWPVPATVPAADGPLANPAPDALRSCHAWGSLLAVRAGGRQAGGDERRFELLASRQVKSLTNLGLRLASSRCPARGQFALCDFVMVGPGGHRPRLRCVVVMLDGRPRSTTRSPTTAPDMRYSWPQ
jgi:hypothetical protein